jgi:hypothetical protein
MRIFTHDDYWIDAKLSDGRCLKGEWLSNILVEPSEDVKTSLLNCARKMFNKKPANEYFKELPPVALDDDAVSVPSINRGFIIDKEFEDKLETRSRTERRREMTRKYMTEEVDNKPSPSTDAASTLKKNGG